MRCNLEWLKQWLPLTIDAERVSEHLTMAGLEVATMEPVCYPLTGVLVARVVAVEQHPAAALKLCKVDLGDNRLRNVICAADNVRADLLTAYAPAGAVIAKSTITVKNIRGYDSDGMLCSAYELGMAEEQEGLLELPNDAKLGQSLVDYLKLNDIVYDLDLTPNRADCLSIVGVARELSVICDLPFKQPPLHSVGAVHQDVPEVQLLQPDACPRYLAREIHGLDTQKTTPLWMTERLRRCGIRTLHPVVDILNFVMLELGQPMHAFDKTAVKGALCIRLATGDEELKVLGGTTVKPDNRTLVIADTQQVLAIAGIIGGEHSAIKEDSTDLILESAFFRPPAILGRARQYRLQTESSHRFERGVDFELQAHAMEYASHLITELLDGAAGPTVEVKAAEQLPSVQPIVLNKAAPAACLGVAIEPDFITKTLTRLGCELNATDSGWQCIPPSYRFDLAIAEDLIEEIARIYGYDRIPETLGSHRDRFHSDNSKPLLQYWNDYLTAQGYFEVITYSFISPKQLLVFTPEADIEMLQLDNPVSVEMSVMRTSLWPGLLQVLKYNLNRQQDRVCIFEQGSEFFVKDNQIGQRQVVAGLVAGTMLPQRWHSEDRQYDFYDVKGDIENLLGAFAHQLIFKPSAAAGLHAGQCADIYIANKRVGRLAALAPPLAAQYKVNAPIFLFELQCELIDSAELPRYQAIPSYPSVRRDLSFVVAKTIGVTEILDYIDSLHVRYLVARFIFDVFEDQQLGADVKNIGIALIFQASEQTLEKDNVDALVQTMIARMTHKFSAELRL